MPTDDLYIPDGAILKCNKSATIQPLTVTPKKFTIYNRLAATISDNVPIVNIPSFGRCSINKSACMPTALKWEKFHEGALKIGKTEPLIVGSYCKCQIGGTIDVFLTEQKQRQH